jgi:hypothetical protein
MEPKFQLIEWGNKYMEVNSGTIDCIWNGFTFNCADDDGIQRTDKVDVSYAYMNNEQCVVVKAADVANFNTAEALAGKKVSAEDGSAGEGVAKDFVGDNGTYIGVTAQMNTLTELKSGNVDFVVIDKTMAKSIIGKGDYADLAIAEEIEIEAEQYAIGFKKGSKLTADVNAQLEALAPVGQAERKPLSLPRKVNFNPAVKGIIRLLLDGNSLKLALALHKLVDTERVAVKCVKEIADRRNKPCNIGRTARAVEHRNTLGYGVVDFESSGHCTLAGLKVDFCGVFVEIRRSVKRHSRNETVVNCSFYRVGIAGVVKKLLHSVGEKRQRKSCAGFVVGNEIVKLVVVLELLGVGG